jgi:hypothetical protein
MHRARSPGTRVGFVLIALCALGCADADEETRLLVGGQRWISELVASSTHVAFVDGADATTDPGLEGIRVRAYGVDGRLLIDAPVEGSVRKLALSPSSVAVLEGGLGRQVVRIHPLSGGPAVEPEQQGWPLGLAALDDGFLWVEARLIGLEDSDGDRSAELGVSIFSLVESDDAGLVRSRSAVTMNPAVREWTSLLLPFPPAVDLVVAGDQALFAWDASGYCGGHATVFGFSRAASAGSILWRGRSALTSTPDPAGGICTCAVGEDNVAETIDAIAAGSSLLVAGRTMKCASIVGGDGYLLDGGASVAVHPPMRWLAADDGAVFGGAGETVVQIDHGTVVPKWRADEQLHGLASVTGQLYVATRREVRVVAR